MACVPKNERYEDGKGDRWRRRMKGRGGGEVGGDGGGWRKRGNLDFDHIGSRIYIIISADKQHGPRLTENHNT